MNRQVEDADDGNGLHDDAEVGSVIDVGAKGSVIDVGAKGKPAPKRPKRSRKDKGVDPDALFGDGAPLHALTRCTVPIWNSSASAVDVGESVNYLQRLNGAKLATEAWNINGLRAKASELLTGEFLRPSLYGVAQHADKVRLQA